MYKLLESNQSFSGCIDGQHILIITVIKIMKKKINNGSFGTSSAFLGPYAST